MLPAVINAFRASRSSHTGALKSLIALNTQVSEFHASGFFEKEVDFKLADIGEGIAEVEIMEWFVKKGDRIQQFDKVCEVQSDKATVEITSRFDGVITKVFHNVGDLAPVGQPLVSIEVGDDAEVEAEVEASPAATAAEPAAAAAGTPPPVATTPAAAPIPAAPVAAAPAAPAQPVIVNERPLTAPAVRRIAREHNLDLRTVLGTGPNGRILKSDVLSLVASGGAGTAAPAATPPPAASAPAAPAPAAPVAAAPVAAAPVAAVDIPAAVVPSRSSSVEDREVAVSGIQRLMVRSMTEALKVPHFGYSDEFDMGEAMAIKKQLSSLAAERGLKLSNMPLILKAASLALHRYPSLNAHVKDDVSGVVVRGSHNIGVAMDTPRGLLVPVVKGVQDLSVLDIAQELLRLQAMGEAGKLGEAELSGGTFTLSNIGAIGGTYAKPVLVVPQVCIGALGRIQRLPRFDEEDNVVAAHIMNVSWAADHRVVDGATMARFSNLMRAYLANPLTMLADLK